MAWQLLRFILYKRLMGKINGLPICYLKCQFRRVNSLAAVGIIGLTRCNLAFSLKKTTNFVLFLLLVFDSSGTSGAQLKGRVVQPRNTKWKWDFRSYGFPTCFWRFRLGGRLFDRQDTVLLCVSRRPVGYRESRLTPAFLMLWIRKIHIHLAKRYEEEQGNGKW